MCCIAGALSFFKYRAGLEAAGFAGIELTPTHEVADETQSAIARAAKPAIAAEGRAAELVVESAGCCGGSTRCG